MSYFPSSPQELRADLDRALAVAAVAAKLTAWTSTDDRVVYLMTSIVDDTEAIELLWDLFVKKGLVSSTKNLPTLKA